MNIVNPNALEEETVLMPKDPILVYNNNQTADIIKLDNLSGIFKKNSNKGILNSIKIKSSDKTIDYKNKISTTPSNQNYQVFHKNYNINNPTVKDYYKNELYDSDLKWDFYTMGSNARGSLDIVNYNILLNDEHTGNNLTNAFNLSNNSVNLAAVNNGNITNYRYNDNISGVGGNYFLYFELTNVNLPDSGGEEYGTLVHLASLNKTTYADCGMSIAFTNNGLGLMGGGSWYSGYNSYGGTNTTIRVLFDEIRTIKSIIRLYGKYGVGLHVKTTDTNIIITLYGSGNKKTSGKTIAITDADNGILTGLAFGGCFSNYKPIGSSTATDRDVSIRNIMLFKDFNQFDLFSSLRYKDSSDLICLTGSNNPDKEVTVGFENAPTALDISNIALDELDISNCKDLENLSIEDNNGGMKYFDISQNPSLKQCKFNLSALKQLKLYSKVKNKAFIILFDDTAGAFGVYLGDNITDFSPDSSILKYYVSLSVEDYNNLCEQYPDLTIINL